MYFNSVTCRIWICKKTVNIELFFKNLFLFREFYFSSKVRYKISRNNSSRLMYFGPGTSFGPCTPGVTSLNLNPVKYGAHQSLPTTVWISILNQVKWIVGYISVLTKHIPSSSSIQIFPCSSTSPLIEFGKTPYNYGSLIRIQKWLLSQDTRLCKTFATEFFWRLQNYYISQRITYTYMYLFTTIVHRKERKRKKNLLRR